MEQIPDDSTASSDAEAGVSAAPPGELRKKVLVIDDSPTVVKVVRDTITQMTNYAVVEAHDGVEGLEQLQREQPDCVVVDVMMPHMDGFQFVRVLRGDSTSRQTPLIILTTLSSDDKRLTGLLSGADEYVTKPFVPRDLCAALDRVMSITPEERERRITLLAGGGSDKDASGR